MRLSSDVQQPSRKVRIGRYLPLIAFFLPVFSLGQTPQSPPPALIHDGQTVYASNCSGCHGADTLGTDHAPKLTGNPDLRRSTVDQLRNLIKSGIPSGGMPAFGTLPAQQIDAITAYVYIPIHLPSATCAPSISTLARWPGRLHSGDL